MLDQALTPLDALYNEDAPHPDLAQLAAHADGSIMTDHVARMAAELSESEAYDAQILAGLVCP